jgi:hypothetical protein
MKTVIARLKFLPANENRIKNTLLNVEMQKVDEKGKTKKVLSVGIQQRKS